MKSYIQVKVLAILSVMAFLMLQGIAAQSALARSITVRSGLVTPGDTIVVPIEMSGDITQVTGFQMDLSVTPTSGAPAAMLQSIEKGNAVTTQPVVDTNPVPPTQGPVRIGLPVEIPLSGTIIPDFAGPGILVNLTIEIPTTAVAGQGWVLDLSNVVLAGPNHPFAGLSVSGGTLTVSDTVSAFADTISTDIAFSLDEGQTRELTAQVTGGGAPVPGVTLSFSIDNPDKASFSADTAVTGADGVARINVTGLEDGASTIRVSSPLLGENTIALSVNGISPIITSSPSLETTPGAAYTYDADATDPQGQTLAWALLENPAGMIIDPGTGLLTWPSPARPSGSDEVTVTVEARDPDDNTDTQTYTLFVVVDSDGDGYDDRADCDDSQAAVNPGEEETPYNGVDDDCNPDTPDDDLDGDGFDHTLDCDDNNPSVNPNATEILYNGLDDDCDPSTMDYIDTDLDGYYTEQNAGYPSPADCDDNDPEVNPGQPEILFNGLDDDCNPATPDAAFGSTFVIAIDDAGRIYYAKSNGDGSFSDYKQVGDIDSNARGVLINDFNTDGHLDFVAGAYGYIYLYVNNGDDTFTSMGRIGTMSNSGNYIMDMAGGDFNNDGFMDFLANTNSNNGPTGIFLGDGSGGFTKTEVSLGGYGRGMDTADFNNDGILDFARAQYSNGNTYVYLGNGDGTFGDPLHVYDTGSDPYGLAAADFDNDGNADLIINDGSGGTPHFFQGNGDGSFSFLGTIPSLDFNNHGAYDAYDLNGDGLIDIIASTYTTRDVRYYESNGDGTFKEAVQIGTTSSNCLGISAPPIRKNGMPYAILRPKAQTISLGDTAAFDGSFSNDNDDGGSITEWAWEFGDGGTDSGPGATYTYTAEGIYSVLLTVTDNSGLNDRDRGQVIVNGDSPTADAGGPYIFGEEYANAGYYTVPLNGSGSADDFGIADYLWQITEYHDFSGTELDELHWIVSTGVVQDEAVSITGAGNWTTRYMAGRNTYTREEGLSLTARINPGDASATQRGMFGFKNISDNYNYNQLTYAFYFNNDNLYIYEDGSNRGVFTTYDRTLAYDIKIVLKATGAMYYFKEAGESDWTLLRDSSHSSQAELKFGCTISYGEFEIDDVEINDFYQGESPTPTLVQGTYDVSLTVTDSTGQQGSDTTTLQVIANDPPAAHPGGPYTGDESNALAGEWLIEFNGSGSTDDFGIMQYAWDFNTADGISVDGTGPDPVNFYTAPGQYTVSLTVTDHALQSHTMETTVTIDLSTANPPEADPGGPYNVNEESASEGLWTVFFDGSGSSDDQSIQRYVWDFGDGGSLTTWYAKEQQNFFEAGTRLYGYDIPDAKLDIIATQDNTTVRIVDLDTGSVITSNTLNRYGEWQNVSLTDGIYFKVEADKPVVAYQTDDSYHSAFATSVDSGPVGHQFFIKHYDHSSYTDYYIFAFEDTVVRIFNTSDVQVAEQAMAAGTYWQPGLTNNTVYRVLSTGKVSMQTVGINGYTTVPSSESEGAGTLFYGATWDWNNGSFVVFAYEDADVTVHDMDSGDLLYTQTITGGSYWWQNGVGRKRLKFESTADVEVWAGDNEGGTGIANFGDDISFAGGRDNGKEFYAHGLADGLVIFAPYDGTTVQIDGLTQELDKDEYLPLAGGALYHITSDKPVVIQTLGRANSFNDMGTYLGGVSQVYHEYDATGNYDLTLTVYDQGNLSHTADTEVTVIDSDPPVSEHGGPYAVDETDAAAGLWRVELDASASSDDYAIYKIEWDFDDSDGISVDSTELSPTYFYDAPGTYTVTLRVYDHALQMTEVTTTVTVEAGSPPTADAGGPYVFGEEAAQSGVYPVTFDGSGSTDDVAIYNYKWAFGDNYSEPFDGTLIDETRWIASDGVVQNGIITVTGNNTWGQRYAFTQEEFLREGGNTFFFKVRSASGGTNRVMIGLKNNSTNYSHTHMPYAIYMEQYERFCIYEENNNRGYYGNFELDTWYDLKIELKQTQGALYYYKKSADTDWILLYDSDYATRATRFKAGMTVSHGVHDIDDVRVEKYGNGVAFTHVYNEPGTYQASLTVTDNAMQTDTDSKEVVITVGDPPVADAGGPYTGEPFSFIRFNGAASTDDTAITKYEWDFGDGNSGTGAGATHFYRTPGTYTVTLTVYDNLNQTDTDTAELTIAQGTVPIADAGGPYIGGPGGPPVFFDGSSSSDDSGVLTYTWDLEYLDDFSIDPQTTEGYNSGANYGGSVTHEDGMVTLVGGNSWGGSYLEVKEGLERKEGISFSGKIRTNGGRGSFMIGWRDSQSGQSYLRLIYGIYFDSSNRIRIYEDGSPRVEVGTYANDQWYEFKIVLKSTGADYYLDGSLIYESTYSSEALLRPMMTTDAYSQSTDDWRVEGLSIQGKKPFFTYPAPGIHPIRLTVEDGVGQTDTALGSVQILENLPPKVICVPWVATDLKFPHELYNGKTATLKGVVKDGNAATYQWDFGDGTQSAVMDVTDPYDLSIKHTYPDVPNNTPFIATLKVWDSKGLMGTDNYNIVVKDKTIDVEINVGIDDGLWYLHTTMDRSRTSTDGRWTGYSNYYASPTGSALQAFQINTHLESGDPQENPYVETVNRGLRYLFTCLREKNIITDEQDDYPHGYPDTNGNGIGVEVASGRAPYEGGMAMMALAATATPLAIAPTGGDGIKGRFYYDILTDMVDMYAWGQSDTATNRGGWRYTWNQGPDNSACQWGALGLEAAEEAFNIHVPDWVKEQNLVWLNYSWNGTGWGYGSSGNGQATTPSGLAQLAFNDIPKTDWRWINAENYLASVWDSWYNNTKNYYALYALAKAMRISQPDEVVVMAEGTPWAIDWYRDNERGVARTVLNDQDPDGSFRVEGNNGHYLEQNPFRAAWGVVILSKTLFVKPPVADAGPDRVYGVDWELTLDGSGSYHTDPFRSIVRYEWDVDNDGIYDYAGSEPTVKHTYRDLGVYTVTLKVTDDNVPPKFDTDTAVINIAIPPHPPVSVAGGPYTATSDVARTLDGTGSFDIDPSDSIHRYGWELDGVFPYDYDDAFGPNPSYTWTADGTFNVGLKVWDNGVLNDVNGNGAVDEDERLTDIHWTTISVVTNYPPVADPNGPYTVDEGSPVTLDGSGSTDPNNDTLTYAWDLDNDGVFDDASGVNPTYTFNDDGIYPVTLEVSDSALSNTAGTTVTVNDLSPTAGFTWAPEPQEEGAGVQFTDTSTSPVDDIDAWTWDFAGFGTSTEQNPAFTFNDNGTYMVTLTVTDEDGSTDMVSHTVTISDRGPSAAFTWLPEPQEEGGVVNFTDASTSSPDTIQSWAWDFAGLAASTEQDPSFTFDENGIYTVTLTVTDDDGTTSTVSHNVTITDRTPAAVLTGDTLLDEGQTGSYDAGGSSSSPDPIIGYEWDWDYNGATFDPSGDTGAVQTHTWMDNGTYTVAVRVTDDDGSTDIATLAVTVNDLDPTAVLTGDTFVNEGQTGNWDAGGSSSSPDAIIGFEWDWDYDGTTFTPTGETGAIRPHNWITGGVYTVAIRVTDDDGSTDIATMNVTVGNQGPVAALTGDTLLNEGDTGDYDAGGSTSSPDPIVNYEWDWDYDGTTFDPSGDTGVTASHLWPENGTFTIAVRVTDQDGSTDIASLGVVVNNMPPVVNAEPDQTITEGGTADFTGTFTDPGTLDTHTIVWDFGDGSPPVSDTLTTDHTYADDGVYTVTLTVTDNDGGTGTDSVIVTVEPPVTGTIIVEKQTDPDGAAESFTFTGDAQGSISDGEQIVVTGLPAGTYTVQEALPSGWELTDISVDDSNSTIDMGSRTVTFHVEAGETVRAVFLNTKKPSEPICGDLDLNGIIDNTDFQMFISIYGKCNGTESYFDLADYDHDGCITMSDYSAWYACYIQYMNSLQ